MYTKEVNEIVLSSNDDKRLQTSDRITTYPYGTNAFKACESEMLKVKNLFFEKLQLKLAYFYQIFIFSRNYSPSKSMKNAFYFI